MASILIAVISFFAFIIAYNTYGRFLARKLFALNADALTPAHELEDGVDYVPTKRSILFGHHYSSIAGTGPIVGPAIAVIWGWLPALLWVVLGSIFMGAVHDFGTLVISARAKGESIGELSEKIISPRVRTLLLLIIFFTLWIVVAIFALIIGVLLIKYPMSVFAVWMEIPLALLVGYMIYKKKANLTLWSLIAVGIMYITIYLGTFWQLSLPSIFGLPPIMVWLFILLIYAYIASTLPVTTLLQPRDYINSHELFIGLILLGLGLFVGHHTIVAPAIQAHPAGAPPLVPFIFITIACGAISGFHGLVSSGTSSKQLNRETDAQMIGYGGMLLEAALAILVILACVAGFKDTQAWNVHYISWSAAGSLGAKVDAFVEGGASFLASIGIGHNFALALLSVFVVSFAGTTLDTATRIQRYVISELAEDYHLSFLAKRHPATILAVGSALFLALLKSGGEGGLILWPLFGTVNQLLAGLTLLVLTVYFLKRAKPASYFWIPMLFMIIMTGWAMIVNLINFINTADWLLVVIDVLILLLEVWMILEVIRIFVESRKRGQSASSHLNR
ncbi:MAG: carbon starvation protein A [Armatimonadetes bacterium CG07_land_8_20_14_0_80_40_9]|nr:MAG: carbon starvation protein A [Armatimonadetes bacterium CG07_land_8_20_14_0_80_40_9]